MDSHFFSRLRMEKLKSGRVESDRWFASFSAWVSPRLGTAILPVSQNGIAPTRKLKPYLMHTPRFQPDAYQADGRG